MNILGIGSWSTSLAAEPPTQHYPVNRDVRLLVRIGIPATFIGIGFCFTVLAPLPTAPIQLAIVGGVGVAILPWVIGAFGEFDIFSPIYAYSVGFFALFVLRPTVMYAFANYTPSWLGYDISQTYSQAMFVAILGTLAIYAGFYLGPSPRRGALRLPLRLSTTRLAVGTIALLMFSAVVYAYFIISNGGVATLALFFSGRSGSVTALLQSSSGYLYTAPLWLTSAGILLLAVARSWYSLSGLFGVLLIFSSQLIPLSFGDRSWFLPALMAVAVVYYLRRSRRPGLPIIALLMPVVFILGITVPREYRDISVRQNYTVADVIAATVNDLPTAAGDFITGLDTAMLDDLAVEISVVPQDIDYQHGMTYVEALARPVPRAAWPAKPVAAETTLMDALWPSLSNATQFTFSLFGEPFFDGGALGVAIFGFLFGGFWRYLWLALRDQFNNPIAMALYGVSLPFMVIYLRGGVGLDYQREVIFTARIVVLVIFAAVRQRVESRDGSA